MLIAKVISRPLLTLTGGVIAGMMGYVGSQVGHRIVAHAEYAIYTHLGKGRRRIPVGFRQT